MEVFPLDIKKMVIQLVSEGKSYNLRHLFCVNKAWRRLVSDYLVNNIQKGNFEYFLCCSMMICLETLYDWNVIEILSEQWRGTYLLSSFIMYLDASVAKKSNFLKLSYPRARELFLSNSFLLDLRTMDRKLDTISQQEDEIETLSEKLTNAVAEKEAAERVFQELDEKWSNKKRKTINAMEGLYLLFFEASVVTTTLTGEPNVAVFCLIAIRLIYARVLDDTVFYIFFGALCVTLMAKLDDWKPKGKYLSGNLLEAAFILLFTCYLGYSFLYFYTIDMLRCVVSCLLYAFATNQWEPSAIILGLRIFDWSGLFDSSFKTTVYYTLFYVVVFLSIVLWHKLRKQYWNESTRTDPDEVDNNHVHNE